MRKEVADKLYREKGIVIVPYLKKIWYSITKFEKYPEMAAEGVGRALLYLTQLMLMFAIIIAIGTGIRLDRLLDTAGDYLEKNISEINYQEGNLSIQLVGENKEFITEVGTVIIDTEATTSEKKLAENELQIIWLKDHVSLILGETQNDYYYKDILNQFGVTSFNKTDFMQFVANDLRSPKLYVSYFIMMTIYMFVLYFLLTIMNILILSIFGVLTSLIAKIKMRYRAVFNMAVYSITLSVILELIYTVVRLFVNFEIKYFDLMYTAISYICLTAAIFMIKSDVIKQHIELMKIIKEKGYDQPEQNRKEEKEEDKEKEETEDKEEKKENKKKEVDDGIESEGSKA